MLLNRRPWLAATLVVSLGVNLFLAGMVMGRGGHGPFPPGPPPGGPPAPDEMIQHLADTLPPADAAIVRKSLEVQRPLFEADMRRRRDFIGRIQEMLQADPFDLAATERMLSEEDRAEQESRKRMSAMIVDVVRVLSPEGRKRLASFPHRE